MAAELPGGPFWAFDLIAPEGGRRSAALDRHRELLEQSAAALRWMNRVWAEAGTPAPAEPRLAAEMHAAQAAFTSARARTLFGPVDAFLDSSSLVDTNADSLNTPFALLFLRWEARYPDEWREAGRWAWSPWGTKELLLDRFARRGVPAEYRSGMTGLVIAASGRPYRCKDWMYARLARLVDGRDLRDQIAALAGGMDPLLRLRGRYLLHVLEHPAQRVTRGSWRRWLSTEPDVMQVP